MLAHDRGRGLAVELAINIFGVMMAYWVDYGMSFTKGPEQFRFPLAFQIFFAIVTAAGVLVLPESPRWLIAHDRHDEARTVLWAIHRNARSLDPSDERFTRALNDIDHAIKEEREASSGSSYRALFRNGEQKFFYRTMLGIGGQFMQQLSGINLITYVCGLICCLLQKKKEKD